MTGWLLLSDREWPVAASLPDRLTAGTLVMEMSWPLPAGVLLDWRGPQGQALSLFHHPHSGLALLWREGAVLRRFLLPGLLRLDGRTARLLFRWSDAEGTWQMRLDDGLDATVATTCGLQPPVFDSAMLAQLCAGQGVTRRESSVLWFGITAGVTPPVRAAWIGLSTPIPTLDGLVPAGTLRPGQWVVTRDAGPVRLREVRRMDMPSRGSHAAIVLRAPFFARSTDLLVSADQLVGIAGLEAEYLFGEDEVLVAAGALVDGRTALADNRRATAAGVSLDLGGLYLIDSLGCTLMSAHHGAAAQMPILPLRALQEYEALPLMSLLRRLKSSDAA
ncbi:MAG: Hint domain-containing protein [Paracoccaceae bacterium]